MTYPNIYCTRTNKHKYVHTYIHLNDIMNVRFL